IVTVSSLFDFPAVNLQLCTVAEIINPAHFHFYDIKASPLPEVGNQFQLIFLFDVLHAVIHDELLHNAGSEEPGFTDSRQSAQQCHDRHQLQIIQRRQRTHQCDTDNDKQIGHVADADWLSAVTKHGKHGKQAKSKSHGQFNVMQQVGYEKDAIGKQKKTEYRFTVR